MQGAVRATPGGGARHVDVGGGEVLFEEGTRVQARERVERGWRERERERERERAGAGAGEGDRRSHKRLSI